MLTGPPRAKPSQCRVPDLGAGRAATSPPSIAADVPAMMASARRRETAGPVAVVRQGKFGFGTRINLSSIVNESDYHLYLEPQAFESYP